MSAIHGPCQRCHKSRSLIRCYKFGRNRKLCAACKREMERMVGGYSSHGMGATKNPVEK